MKERLKKAKNFCKENLRDYDLVFAAVMTLMALFLSWIAWRSNGQGGFFVFAIVLTLVSISIFWGVWLMRKKNVAICKQFLFVGVIFGVLFILLLPPGQAPDDINHFRRAYGITDGIIVASEKVGETEAVGSNLPVEAGEFEDYPSSGAYERVGEALSQGDSGEKAEQAYTNTALYNFLCYLPQAFAASIGRILGMSTMGIAYLMKIFNFVVWILLTYFAIKLIPKFKKVVLFIALLPITLQEATSMAPDALTIGLGLFLVSYVLYLAYGHKEKAMSRGELAVLYVLAILIGFCKIVYFPLVLLYLVIPDRMFGGKKRKWLHLGIIFGVSLVLNLLWLMVSSGMLIEFNPGVNSKEQLMMIIKNPLRYLVVMFNTVNAHSEFWLSNMLGMLLGAFSFNLPNILFYMSFAVLVILFAQRDERIEMQKYDRAVFILVFLLILALIFTSLYIQWTAVGAALVDGIQGRYFLPILLLIPIMMSRKNNKKTVTLISERGIVYYSVMVDIVALVAILSKNV